MTVTELVLVRHGESEGNVAREVAEADGAEVIAIDDRDADVRLSGLGRSQATAFGRWLAELPDRRRPVAVWTSPYTRARETATIALSVAELNPHLLIDERLRDRELGILDRLTSRGVANRHPDEADRRRHLGKLYYRPPGGEAWTDVVLRLRSFWRDADATTAAGTVLVFAHDAVILLTRYVLEGLDEQQLLDIASRESVGNAAITRLVRRDVSKPWQLEEFNSVEHLTRFGSEPTAHEAEQDVHPR